jgi:hypothetical protein
MAFSRQSLIFRFDFDVSFLSFDPKKTARNLSQLEIAHQIAQRIATPYRMLRVNGSNSVCDTKSHAPNRICDLQQIGHEIATPNRSCNQPLSTRFAHRLVSI